jgi:hypothetical protein
MAASGCPHSGGNDLTLFGYESHTKCAALAQSRAKLEILVRPLDSNNVNG